MVVSTSVLCEDTDVLNDLVVEDGVVEWSVKANTLFEDPWDVAAVGVDVVLGLDEVGERCVDEISLPEVVEDVVRDELILDLVLVDENKENDSWTFEEVEVVAILVSRLDEERGWSVDDGLVSNKREELVSADKDVVPVIPGLSEDIAGDASTTEDGRDAECVQVESFPRSVAVVEYGRDVAILVIDVVFALFKVVVRRLDDDLIPEIREEVWGADDAVILGPVGVDEIDVDSELEPMEEIVCAEVDCTTRFVEAVDGKFDDISAGEEERVVAGVDSDAIS